MEQTPKYGLKKPGFNDYGDVNVLNENADKIDAALHRIESRSMIQVGGEEPAAGPCIWFDTSGSGSVPNTVSASLELGGPGDTAELMAQIDGVDHPVENAKTGGTPMVGEYNFEII